MKPEQAAKLLGQARLFEGLTPETLTRLGGRATSRRFRRNQVIFQEGDPAQSFFLIAEGSVKVFRTSSEGETVILVTLREGESFGELSLVDGKPRSASAEAMQPTIALELGREPFLEAMHEEPHMSEAVMVALGGILRRLTEQAADLVFLDLHGRVAKLLVQMADDHGKVADDAIELDLGLTQSEIASMVGGSRQSVNQVLRSFEHRDYLEVRGRTMILKQPDMLRRRATP